MDTQHVDQILKLPICKGEAIEQEGNIFTAFTMAVDSHEAIQEAYLKMKLCNPKARHIICAYYLDGPEYHFTRGSCDDGEHGAGEMLLKFMLEYDLNYRVIFITRHYSGKNIGLDHYKQILTATQLCLRTYPNNKITEDVQDVPDVTELNYTTYTKGPDQKERQSRTEMRETGNKVTYSGHAKTNPKRRRESNSPDKDDRRKFNPTWGKGKTQQWEQKRRYSIKK